MQVGKNTVVEFHYDVSDDGKRLLETTRDGAPTAILYGHRNAIRGLERALEGRSAGDRFVVTVSPDEGYGPVQPNAVRRVPKKHFSQPRRLKPGVIVQLRTEQGVRPVTVVKVGGKVVDVDTNHPHAGKTLTFDIEITGVREASAEELAHRHAHGPGQGHH